jgi:hypothetical protein
MQREVRVGGRPDNWFELCYADKEMFFVWFRFV